MKAFYLAVALAIPMTASADLADELSDLVGWEIMWSGRVTGHQDAQGKQSDDYEGCDFDMKLILDDTYTVTCNSFHYAYAYNPRAVLMRNGSRLKLIVKDKAFNVTR